MQSILFSDNLKYTTRQLREALKYAAIAGVVAFISILFPRSNAFPYQYKAGETWRYADLVATFDFPIQKAQDVWKSERLSASQAFVPYFKRLPDASIKQGIVDALARQYSEAANTAITDDLRQAFDRRLTSLFDTGVLDPAMLEYNERKLSRFRLDEDDASVMHNVSNFLQVADVRREIENWLRSYTEVSIEDVTKIVEHVNANIVLDEERSGRVLQAELDAISLNRGMVKKDEVVVAQGAEIDEDALLKLDSFRQVYEFRQGQKGKRTSFIGYLLLTILIMTALLLYLKLHFRSVFDRFSHLLFILLWLVVFSYLVFIVETKSNLSTYIIPFCIVPIIIKNFFNERLALFVHIVVVLIASYLSKLGYEFTFLQMLAGIVTVLAVSETRYWNRFFFTIIYIFLTYVLAFIGLSLIQGQSISDFKWIALTWFALNALLTLLAYPFIPLIERVFGFTSSITLAELCDLNRPLLKRLSVEAPGTFQHSLQVANLSEAAADKIRANALLVKAASLYHDVGKLSHPQFFIENQSSTNPHDGLNNFESARRIIEHVEEGEKMAQKARLPQQIIDIIRSHHGTTRTEYFYRNQLNQFPDREFDETLFRYPGPKPASKEEAIVMMADSLEASSKSLKNPTGRDIDTLVEQIVAGKIQQGQLEDCDLTFSELEDCKSVFKSLLRSINHVRIEYPPESPTKEEE